MAVVKQKKGKKKKKQSAPAKSIEDLQVRLESIFDKKSATRQQVRRKPRDEIDDTPDYSMQRDLYGSRSYGQKPARGGGSDAYGLSPREQRDLYDHFGKSEDARNIFDEDYPAPESPEERLRNRLR